MTQEQAIIRVAEKTVQNSQDIKQKNLQRRHNVVDMYGIEYVRQGGAGAPATFRLSLSPDYAYVERFEFKIIIEPFAIPIAGNGIEPTSLTVNGNSISPNPHTHDVLAGITFVTTTATDFRMYVEGIDITPYLAAQHDVWIDGEGVFPSTDLMTNFDLLEVASDMKAEGHDSEANMILEAGYKKVQLTSNSPFQAILVHYPRFSHMNR